MEPETLGTVLIMAVITLSVAVVVNMLMLKQRRVSQEQENENSHLNRTELSIGKGTLFIVVAVLFGVLYVVSGVLSGASVSQADISPGDFITLTCQGGDDVHWQSRGRISYNTYRDRTECTAEATSREDFLLTVSQTLHRVYQYLVKEEPKVTLGEVELTVQVMQARARTISVDWWDSSVIVQWKRWAREVLKLGKDPRDVRLQFTGRASLTNDRMVEDNISLVLKDTHHVDQGLYLCFFMKDKDIRLATEINVTGKEPHSPSTVFVKAGEEVDLLCFGRVDWFGTEAEFVQWKMKDQMVLQWEKGSQIVGSQFTGRVLLPKEKIYQNNICLVLKNISHADQGSYECLFVKDQIIRLGTQINLTVTDHMTRLEAGFGSSVLLPLHTVSPVIVSFLPDGGNGSVRVCEVEKEQMECGAAYSHRTDLQQHSLELRKLSMEDSGTFSVMERETRRTVSVLFIHVFPPSTDTGVSRDAATALIVIIILFVLIFVATVVMVMRRWRQMEQEQQDEVHHLNRDSRDVQQTHYDQ
ncbi:uncharacterized protein LOC118824128 isoform X2 [Colossoma macropomum]|nr:uncharacterized protein LOC118824128 isoform X2 [Colossoma macropomum]